jgi:hypothetical protein
MRRALQVVLAVLSVIPLVVAVAGITQGAGRLLPEDVVTAEFDTHYRYVCGYYLSLTALVWYVIPRIEHHAVLVRIACIGVFAGGIGRVFSAVDVGAPGALAIGFTAFELAFPLLAVWQAYIARSATGDAGADTGAGPRRSERAAR